ncbi:Stress response protein nst1, partial [Coemansia sp. RSA 1722]
MSAKTSTSPGTDARSDSVRRGGYAAGDNSSSSNKDRKAQTDSGSSSRQTAVYGPELPPSMLRSKVDSAAAGIADISNPPNFIDIAKFLREESRNEHSKSDYMRRTENELQTLFYSHLKSIMDRHGYKGKYFKEQDVARVMVDTGLMSSLSDDPALALASDLKARMISIVHKNMRQMASSVMVPELFEDMAVDPMVIDTLVDMSRQSPSGSKQAASVVAFAAAAAVAEADADFENALKALDTMTLVESFHLDELCRNQQNPALAASHLAATDPELRPPSKPASTPSSSSTTAPASKLTSESASASASKSASKSPSTESGQAAAAQTKATHTAPSIPLLNASLKELAAKTEEMQTKSSQLFDNMDYSTAVEAQAVNAASARNAGLSSSMLPSRAQIKRSRKRLKGKERETTVAANGDAKSRRAPLPETQQPRLSANKKVSQPASGGSKQRPLGHQPVLPPSDSLCQSFLSSSASRPGPVHESLDQSKKPSDQAEKLWSSDSADEHKQVRTFWLSLSDIERQALILVEKEVVLARVRDHQNFSCSCNICSRKREAIEQELDFLYDCYYEELQERVCRGRVRMAIRKMEPIAKANIMSSVEAVVDTAMSNLVASSNGLSKTDLQTAIIKSIKQAKLTSAQANPDNRGPTDIGTFLMRAMTASVLENLSSKDSAAKEKNEHNRDAAIEGAVQAIRSWVSGTLELNKDSSDDMVPSDAESEEILNNNDLFYTENMLDTIGTFPTDSKKFFDMMERLAEYRMRREEVTIEDINDHERAFFANAAPSDKPPLKDRESMTHSWVRRARDSSHRQRHCPDCHGEISESEEQAGGLSNLPNTNLALSAAAKSLLDTDLCYATDSEYEDIDEDGDAIGVFARTSDRVEDTGFYSSDSQDHDCEETNDEDDEDDDEDEDLCDTDEDLDDLDDLDSEYAEREAEEGRKVFQLFAARLFEQRVINTYREKIARERQQNLIKELEDEEKEQQAKEKRKQKKRE